VSFILDALRKSDAQRRRGAAPALLTPQAPPVTLERSRRFYYGLLAVALVGAGIVLGSLRPWHVERPVAATQDAMPREPGSTQSAPLAFPVRQEMARRAQPPAPKEKSPPGAQFASAPAAAALKLEGAVRANAGNTVRARSIPRVGSGDAPRETKVAAFAELPVAIQEEIPSLSISAHAYSPTPRERLIGINDRVLREGEHAAPGLLLEQITPDGMVLSYKGYRFRRGVR